jgi:hypothetical protein
MIIPLLFVKCVKKSAEGTLLVAILMARISDGLTIMVENLVGKYALIAMPINALNG